MSAGAYDEIWCYTYERIEEYLLHSTTERRDDTFYTDGCKIMLEALPERNVGSLKLPRTRVRMEGPQSVHFHHTFLLHFLSGGG